MDINKYKQEVVELCQKLIREESVSGNESGVVRVLSNYMKEKGFAAVNTDRYGNVVGVVKGNNPGEKLLFDGHIDVVPVNTPEKWEYDPYGAQVIDGKIYGRGTSDMKGAVAAYMCAAAAYMEETGGDFNGEIYVDGVVHEECFEGVAARQISSDVKPDYVVIAEASDLNLRVGQRGRAEIVVETFGVPCHSSNPEKGVNAVYKMNKIIQEIQKLELTKHPKLGKGILELTDIKSEPYPGASVVPEYCRVTYDRRLLVGETKESVLKPIEEIIEKLSKDDPELKTKVSYAMGEEKCYTGETIRGERFFPGWLYDENADYIQAVKKEMEKVGFRPEMTTWHFCTNGSHYAGEAGIKTLGLGPSKEYMAHTVDEYIEVEQLQKAVEAYLAVMRALCGTNK